MTKPDHAAEQPDIAKRLFGKPALPRRLSEWYARPKEERERLAPTPIAYEDLRREVARLRGEAPSEDRALRLASAEWILRQVERRRRTIAACSSGRFAYAGREAAEEMQPLIDELRRRFSNR